MAYKWGLLTTYKSWEDPPSRGTPTLPFGFLVAHPGTWMTNHVQLQAAEEALQRLGLAPEEEAGRQVLVYPFRANKKPT